MLCYEVINMTAASHLTSALSTASAYTMYKERCTCNIWPSYIISPKREEFEIQPAAEAA